jgi:hypothetical protein
VLLRSLAILRDLRLASDRRDIDSRHAELSKLRDAVHDYRRPQRPIAQ